MVVGEAMVQLYHWRAEDRPWGFQRMRATSPSPSSSLVWPLTTKSPANPRLAVAAQDPSQEPAPALPRPALAAPPTPSSSAAACFFGRRLRPDPGRDDGIG